MTDDRGHSPAQYHDFMEVFRKVKAETLPPHRPLDHAIDLEPGYKLPYGRIYNLSEFHFKALKANIETNLASDFIQWSSSSATEPIMFLKKHDGGRSLFVNCPARNQQKVKNRSPLPLTSQLLDRVHETQIFTKLCLRNAYHLIRIKGGEEFKSIFRTGYGQFKYEVMPFGLTNSPATFQAYIDDCQMPYIEDVTLCYLHNILIYSTNTRGPEEHACKVLQRLKEFGLYGKVKKCHSEFRKSAFSNLPSIRVGSARSQTAYSQFRTGRPRNQFGMCKCFLALQTSTGDLF